ncbi:MAG: hydrolase [bacterium]
MSERRRVPLDDSGMPVRKADVPPDEPEGCDCPRLEKEDWDAVESDWSDVTFVRTTTNAVLGVPVGYNSALAELRKQASELGATVPEDAMLLNGSGRFRRPVMLEIEGGRDSKEVIRPGGVIFSRLLEAPWGELPRAAERTRKEAAEKYGRAPDDTWIWYLTCRQCSKARKFETLIVTHYRDAK